MKTSIKSIKINYKSLLIQILVLLVFLAIFLDFPSYIGRIINDHNERKAFEKYYSIVEEYGFELFSRDDYMEYVTGNNNDPFNYSTIAMPHNFDTPWLTTEYNKMHYAAADQSIFIGSSIPHVAIEDRIGRNTVSRSYKLKNEELIYFYKNMDMKYQYSCAPYLQVVLDNDTKEILEVAIILNVDDGYAWPADSDSSTVIKEIVSIYQNTPELFR